jgi:hypothetical protein
MTVFPWYHKSSEDILQPASSCFHELLFQVTLQIFSDKLAPGPPATVEHPMNAANRDKPGYIQIVTCFHPPPSFATARALSNLALSVWHNVLPAVVVPMRS